MSDLDIAVTVQQMELAINLMWTTLCTFFVFLMQTGFAMLEAGSVREKNVQGILVKNILDICICTICFFALGYGFAYGESTGEFIGSSLFASSGFGGTDNYVLFLFHWSFAGTATTIISGSLAERTNIAAYLSTAILYTSFVYPVVAHWAWGDGWLNEVGYKDFAGSGVVHLLGGAAGLAGAYIVGPRTGRFENGKEEEFRPSNIPLVVLGSLILWFGWYGFNCGSTLTYDFDSTVRIGQIGMNTTIAAATGGITT